jgi:hypothetical protein
MFGIETPKGHLSPAVPSGHTFERPTANAERRTANGER